MTNTTQPMPDQINFRHLTCRDRNPEEIANRRDAIKNHCRTCMGLDHDDEALLSAAVTACNEPECWLYPWRTGKLNADINDPTTDTES